MLGVNSYELIVRSLENRFDVFLPFSLALSKGGAIFLFFIFYFWILSSHEWNVVLKTVDLKFS